MRECGSEGSRCSLLELDESFESRYVVRKEGIKRYYVVRKEGKDEMKTDKRRNTVP